MTGKYKRTRVPSLKMPAENFINHVLNHSSIYTAVVFIVVLSLVAIVFEK